MSNVFTSYVAKDVGTGGSTLVTVAAATQTTLIGLTAANTSNADVNVDVFFTRSAVDYYIAKGALVPVGKTFIAVGGDQKVVLITGDALKVKSSAANSVDTIASVLNIT